MSRHKTAPVIEHYVPEVADLRLRRSLLFQDLRKLEWRFDREPTLQVAGRLKTLRRDISRLEVEMAQLCEESMIRQLRERVEGLESYED